MEVIVSRLKSVKASQKAAHDRRVARRTMMDLEALEPTTSNLPYHSGEGASAQFAEMCHYSQAVVIDNIVKTSGQGGWDSGGKMDPSDVEGQVRHVFKNVDRVLKSAGLRGWEDVYSLRSYHTDMDSSFPVMVEMLKARIPNHRPILTAVGVTRLALTEMVIEIEVEARRFESPQAAEI